MECRRTARAERKGELMKAEMQIAGAGKSWDAETLDSQEAGLVFFDGAAMLHEPYSVL